MKNMKNTLFALIASVTFASSALAQVSVTEAWIRATVPKQSSTGAFMQIKSMREARLIAARSAIAGAVEIHQMEMTGQIMRMHAVNGIDLPAGKPVDLASGGYHLMLLNLKRQLKEGDTVPLTLTVQGKDRKREVIDLKVPVKALTFVSPQDMAK